MECWSWLGSDLVDGEQETLAWCDGCIGLRVSLCFFESTSAFICEICGLYPVYFEDERFAFMDIFNLSADYADCRRLRKRGL